MSNCVERNEWGWACSWPRLPAMLAWAGRVCHPVACNALVRHALQAYQQPHRSLSELT